MSDGLCKNRSSVNTCVSRKIVSSKADINKNSGTWNVLVGHFRTITRTLLDGYRISSAAGQKTIMGNAREGVVNGFLKNHLPATVGITTGAVLTRNMQSGCLLSQEDIILYDQKYPLVPLGGNQSLAIVESVKATIEVKSEINKDAVRQAVAAARELKAEVAKSQQGRRVFCMLLGFAGPANCETLLKWLAEADCDDTDVSDPNLDCIVSLDPSFIVHGHNDCVGLAPENASCNYKWLYSSPENDDSLIVGFYQLLTACSDGAPFDIAGYLNDGKGLYHVKTWPNTDNVNDPMVSSKGSIPRDAEDQLTSTPALTANFES